MDVLTATLPQQNRSLTSASQQGERNLNSKNNTDKQGVEGVDRGKTAASNVQISVSNTAKARAASQVQNVVGKEDLESAPRSQAGGTEESRALASQQSLRQQGARAVAQAKVKAQEKPPEQSTAKRSNDDVKEASPKLETIADKGKLAANEQASSSAEAQQSKLAEKASAAYSKGA